MTLQDWIKNQYRPSIPDTDWKSLLDKLANRVWLVRLVLAGKEGSGKQVPKQSLRESDPVTSANEFWWFVIFVVGFLGGLATGWFASQP